MSSLRDAELRASPEWAVRCHWLHTCRRHHRRTNTQMLLGYCTPINDRQLSKDPFFLKLSAMGRERRASAIIWQRKVLAIADDHLGALQRRELVACFRTFVVDRQRITTHFRPAVPLGDFPTQY
jgi:hypothetical protein